jgi:hypothetical protein
VVSQPLLYKIIGVSLSIGYEITKMEAFPPDDDFTKVEVEFIASALQNVKPIEALRDLEPS